MLEDPKSSRTNAGAFQPRILLVDRDAGNLRALAATLLAGFEAVRVETCTSGRAALGRIAAIDYDVVVIDARVPPVDGLSLCEALRALRPTAIAVLVTGSDEHARALDALRAGAYDVLEEPVDPAYFGASIARAIEQRRLACEVDRQRNAVRHHSELARIVGERVRELEEGHRMKDEFLAAISHELRTPLTAILGWARLLCGGLLDEPTRAKALESIAGNARSQALLIDDLLDISRIITGKLRLEMWPVDVRAVLDAAVSSVKPAANAKRVSIEQVVESHIGPVAADPERLHQIFWNLLSNAIKFTKLGGRVQVRLAQTESEIEVVVADDGCGIRPGFLPYVFDRLRQQADTTSRSSHRGMGLGLGIVRHLVELHGGTVVALSPGEGRGSTFTVRIPSRPVQAVLEGVPTLLQTLRSHPIESPRALCLQGLHVHVIDDEPEVCAVLTVILQQAGAMVTASASAADGLEAMRRSPPDALLCDIGLPDQDGYELIAALRALPSEQGGRVPAVALTAYAKPEDRKRALSAGFQLHLPKPGPANLALIIADLVEREAVKGAVPPK